MTSWPAFARCPAIGYPITPSPRNATFAIEFSLSAARRHCRAADDQTEDYMRGRMASFAAPKGGLMTRTLMTIVTLGLALVMAGPARAQSSAAKPPMTLTALDY